MDISPIITKKGSALMKKISILLSVFVLILASFGSLTANAATIPNQSDNAVDCSACTQALGGTLDEAIQKLSEQGTVTNLNVSKADRNEIEKIVSKKDKDYSDQLKELKQDKLSVVKEADNFIAFQNLEENGVLYKNVASYTEFYVNKANDQIAKKQVWVNLETKEVESYVVFKMDKDGSNVKEIVTFDKNINTKSNSQGISVKAAAKFHIGDMTFYCGLSGIIACAAAFGGLSVVIPELGAATSLACSVAFVMFCP